MRQRRIKNLEEKMAALSEYIAAEPEKLKGNWRQKFRERGAASWESGPIYLEIGCGKGRFLSTLAAQNPDKLYIGVEGAESVVLRALEKASAGQLPNIIFIAQYIRGAGDFFLPGEIAGIYLNFSDPWPKDRHAKRRLTHRDYLAAYADVLPPGGFIEFKTDNSGLFYFSLEEFPAAGFRVEEQTDDLHRSDYPSRLTETEYEHKFRLLGNRIYYCRAVSE